MKILKRPKKINKSKIKISKLNLLVPNSNFVLIDCDVCFMLPNIM